MTYVMNNSSETKTLPRRRDLPAQEAGRELLVRDPGSGQVHFLNATAAMVWNSCDGLTSIQTCVSRLREAFAVPADVDLTADLREIVVDLGLRGLLLESDAHV